MDCLPRPMHWNPDALVGNPLPPAPAAVQFGLGSGPTGGHGFGAECSPRRCFHEKSKLTISRSPAPIEAAHAAVADSRRTRERMSMKLDSWWGGKQESLLLARKI